MIIRPTAPEFYAIYRVDTLEVLWYELTEAAAHAKALTMCSLPEYKDVPISIHLCHNTENNA